MYAISKDPGEASLGTLISEQSKYWENGLLFEDILLFLF